MHQPSQQEKQFMVTASQYSPKGRSDSRIHEKSKRGWKTNAFQTRVLDELSNQAGVYADAPTQSALAASSICFSSVSLSLNSQASSSERLFFFLFSFSFFSTSSL